MAGRQVFRARSPMVKRVPGEPCLVQRNPAIRNSVCKPLLELITVQSGKSRMSVIRPLCRFARIVGIQAQHPLTPKIGGPEDVNVRHPVVTHTDAHNESGQGLQIIMLPSYSAETYGAVLADASLTVADDSVLSPYVSVILSLEFAKTAA